MNRLAKIEKFCEKIGIFSRINSNSLTLGPYGYLLLNHIKTEWVRSNIAKYSNSYLIDNVDLVKQKFDLNPFVSSIKILFQEDKKQPIGLVNVFEEKMPEDEEGGLFKNKKSSLTSLTFSF